MKILTAAEMREVDRLSTERHGIPSLTLMENAGKKCAEFLLTRFLQCFAPPNRRFFAARATMVATDFVVARHLVEVGAKPNVLLFAAPDEVRGDAATNLKRWQEVSRELQIVRSAGEWQCTKGVDLPRRKLLSTPCSAPACAAPSKVSSGR